MKDNPFLTCLARFQSSIHESAPSTVQWIQQTAAQTGVAVHIEQIFGRSSEPEALENALLALDLQRFSHVRRGNMDRFGDWQAGNAETVLVGADAMVSLDHSEFGGMVTVGVLQLDEVSEARHEQLCERVREHMEEGEPPVTIHVLSSGSFGMGSTPLKTTLDPLVEANYTESQRETFHSILARVHDEREGGRLFLLRGEPGTGKTFFIKSLLHGFKPEIMALLLPPAMITQVAAPDLVATMLGWAQSSSALVLILEDADQALVHRYEANMATVQSLLNLTEGILGDSLNLFVIASTNARRIEFDPALTRPGRMDVVVDFAPLKVEHANTVLEALGSSERVEEATTLARLYALSRGVEPSKPITLEGTGRAGF